MKAEFEKRDVKMIGLSANDADSHARWIVDINDISKTNLQFPIIADPERKVSYLYDMLDAQDMTNIDQKGIAFTIRSVFIIDPAKKVRLTMVCAWTALRIPGSVRRLTPCARCILLVVGVTLLKSSESLMPYRLVIRKA